MVPAVCPDVPALDYQPAIFFIYDFFRYPYRFHPDIAVGIDDVIDQKIQMTSCHKSQYHDFLPWMALKQGEIDSTYDIDHYAHDAIVNWDRKVADECRQELDRRYGKSETFQYAEAYELSEYGSQIPESELEEYFPR